MYFLLKTIHPAIGYPPWVWKPPMSLGVGAPNGWSRWRPCRHGRHGRHGGHGRHARFAVLLQEVENIENMAHGLNMAHMFPPSSMVWCVFLVRAPSAKGPICCQRLKQQEVRGQTWCTEPWFRCQCLFSLPWSSFTVWIPFVIVCIGAKLINVI